MLLALYKWKCWKFCDPTDLVRLYVIMTVHWCQDVILAVSYQVKKTCFDGISTMGIITGLPCTLAQEPQPTGHPQIDVLTTLHSAEACERGQMTIC
jgi:hypothetical protein